MGTIQHPLIGISENLSGHPTIQQLQQQGYPTSVYLRPEDTVAASILLLDSSSLECYPLQQWRVHCQGTIVTEIIPDNNDVSGDLLVPCDWPEAISSNVIRHACEHQLLKQRENALHRELAEKHGHLAQLTGLGVALSSEHDIDKLLGRILDQGISLGYCDAASLFLVNKNHETLSFKLTQNNSVSVPFKEQTLALTKQSIAGYVALTKREVNIRDCYEIPEEEPYQFNNSFDRTIGYRTCSLIALPMLNHRGECLGVLEFINRKIQPGIRLHNPLETPALTQPFDERRIALLRALASLAAVAIENQYLMDNIRKLFDNFVEASVFAIEQRDPTTSGHSFRVADLCLSLAESAPQSPCKTFANQIMSTEDMTQLRYAALLHDFGKVSVRESVLIKANKLHPWELEVLRYRLALAKEHCQKKHLEQLLKLSPENSEQRQALEINFQQEMQKLEVYQEIIIESNKPSILAQEHSEKLDEIRSHLVRDSEGNLCSLLSDTDYISLTIPRGSLTDVERQEIESHVTHTLNFLKRIPWTPELQQIPIIAGAHHEKLDGTGYPNNTPGDQIPYPSQIMAICDIYDALTATDRPYKSAVPLDRALGILEAEASNNKLNTKLVNIFIEARCYEAIKQEHLPPKSATQGSHAYSNHPCAHGHD